MGMDAAEVLGGPAVQKLLAAQRQLVHRDQLFALGLGKAELREAKQRGLLRIFLPGVYQHGEVQDSERYKQRLQASQLWRQDGVIVRRAAGLVHGLDGISAAPVELAVEKRTRRKRSVVFHRMREMRDCDIVVVDGLRVTSIRRTIIDLASELNEERLAWAVECAWRRDAVTPADLMADLRGLRDSGVDGVSLLENVLRDCLQRRKAFDSALEVRMWRLLKAEGILDLHPQYEVWDEKGQMIIDFALLGQGLALETMGAKAHDGDANLERDARRAARLTALGWTVLPVTWKMLEADTPAVMRWIRQAMTCRTWSPTQRLAELRSEAPPQHQLGLFDAA